MLEIDYNCNKRIFSINYKMYNECYIKGIYKLVYLL